MKPPKRNGKGKRKYVRSGRYALENAEDFLPRRMEWQMNVRYRVATTAMKMIEELGPRRFTVVELAKRAEVARSTIYKHFGIKAELLAFCRDYMATEHTELLSEQAYTHYAQPVDQDKDLPPELQRLLQMVRGVSHDLSAHDAFRVHSDLWLLTAAEGIRSGRRPRRPGAVVWQPPVCHIIQMMINGSVNRAFRAREIPPSVEAWRVTQWVTGLLWYHLSVRGPSGEFGEAGYREVEADAWQRLGLEQAVDWLLQGVSRHNTAVPA